MKNWLRVRHFKQFVFLGGRREIPFQSIAKEYRSEKHAESVWSAVR